MELIHESVLYAISTPVYLLVIGLEMVFSHFHHLRFYSLKGTFTNFYLMLFNMGIDLLMRGFSLAVLDICFNHAFIHFTEPVIYWILLLFAQDLMFYILHVADHYIRIFWAVHVTHHSSEEFNLTVGFRSSVFQPVYRFLYFIPLAFAGFKGIDIIFMYSATQIYENH